MKKLFVIFAVLVALAIAAAAAGILLARRGEPWSGPTVLVWRLHAPILDYPPGEILPLPTRLPRDTVGSVYRALSRAREDDSVEGLAVYIQDASFGLAKAQEFRGLLASLVAAGKSVDCYLETAGEGANGTLDYYLATACERIALAPPGELNLLGLYADSWFFRGALDKLKIEPQFAYVGRYKSAGEQFTETEHSPAAEEAITAVVDGFYQHVVSGIAEARGLEPAAVRAAIDGAPYTAAEALELGLVDELAYPDEFRTRLEERAGGAPRFVELSAYRGPHRWRTGQRLAVVFAQGAIIRGPGGVEPWTEEIFLGSDDLVGILRDLTEDDSVAAVVLRVDSPGGSALASDLIQREVELLGAAKPVVVSMSDVAASGGYYIAAKAAKIVAQPATITGSIGVVGGKLVTRRFQAELLGLTHDTLKRGTNADLYSTLEPFTAEQEARYRELMERVYRDFVALVAEGRAMSPDEVEAVAAGRIWTGAQAQTHGLVDELGGLDRAVALAREAAGVAPDARLRLDYYPEPPSLLDLFLHERPPTLPAELMTALRTLVRRAPQMLELPPELHALADPF